MQLQGLAITTPIIGRIAIGSVKELNGKLIPVMEDHFQITKLSQQEGQWETHPLHAACLEKQHQRFWTEKERVLTARGAIDDEMKTEKEKIAADQKLREIPVRLLYNAPDLSMSAQYTAFDRDSRPMCVGNGKDYVRQAGCAKETGHCPGPKFCKFGIDNRCQPLGRLQVQVDGQRDELGVFIQRTSGWNTIRTLTARIQSLHALTAGQIAGIPLTLKVAAKSTAQSFMRPITYLDLRIRDGMKLVDAIREGKEHRKEWEEMGLNRTAFEEAAQAGLANGAFADTDDEGVMIVQEFYPDRLEERAASTDGELEPQPTAHEGYSLPVMDITTQSAGVTSLMDKLAQAEQNPNATNGIQAPTYKTMPD